MTVNNFTDDHPAAPTFTPPELPKRVHVRGITGKNIYRVANLQISKDDYDFTIIIYDKFVFPIMV